jgi:hypothetical protein
MNSTVAAAGPRLADETKQQPQREPSTSVRAMPTDGERRFAD